MLLVDVEEVERAGAVLVGGAGVHVRRLEASVAEQLGGDHRTTSKRGRNANSRSVAVGWTDSSARWKTSSGTYEVGAGLTILATCARIGEPCSTSPRKLALEQRPHLRSERYRAALRYPPSSAATADPAQICITRLSLSQSVLSPPNSIPKSQKNANHNGTERMRPRPPGHRRDGLAEL